MERLWSPWRSAYIQSAGENENASCFLCDCVKAESVNSDNLVVHRTDEIIVVMNRYPYNAGHLLIAPCTHVADIEILESKTAHSLMDAVQQSITVCKNILHPHGFNIGANLGTDAGAGVPGHVHFHIVPRWRGDTNFMPILHEVKIISEALEQMWEQVKAEFEKHKR